MPTMDVTPICLQMGARTPTLLQLVIHGIGEMIHGPRVEATPMAKVASRLVVVSAA